jgi:hypothetical protein
MDCDGIDANVVHGVTAMIKHAFVYASTDDTRCVLFHHLVRMSDMIATSSRGETTPDDMTSRIVMLCKHIVYEIPLVKLVAGNITTELARRYIRTDGGAYTEDMVEYYMTRWVWMRCIMNKIHKM